MLDGWKTYLAAIAALLTAIGVFIQEFLSTGHIEPMPMIMAFIALAILFLRSGLKKQGVNANAGGK